MYNRKNLFDHFIDCDDFEAVKKEIMPIYNSARVIESDDSEGCDKPLSEILPEIEKTPPANKPVAKQYRRLDFKPEMYGSAKQKMSLPVKIVLIFIATVAIIIVIVSLITTATIAGSLAVMFTNVSSPGVAMQTTYKFGEIAMATYKSAKDLNLKRLNEKPFVSNEPIYDTSEVEPVDEPQRTPETEEKIKMGEDIFNLETE